MTDAVKTGMVRSSAFRTGANLTLDSFANGLEVEPVSIVAEDGANSRGVLYSKSAAPAGNRRPRVGVHIMHPRTDQWLNYNAAPLAQAGYMVLARSSRWVNNDVATEHEKLVVDVAAGVALLRDRGCEQVVLLGNSGGGTLAAFYQSQAELPAPDRLIDTASGKPYDLNGFDLPEADGLVLIGAHLGQGASLLKWIDPSVTNDADPDSCNSALDMYDPTNGFQLPPTQSRYSDGFIAEFRAAQRLRVERLDRQARRLIRSNVDAADDRRMTKLQRDRRSARVYHMPIYRNMADPVFCDLTIDPDDRVICAYNNDPRPDLVNWGRGAVAIVQPQAWLSTWSGITSRASTVANMAGVHKSTLVVHYAGDSITRVSEAEQIAAACAGEDAELTIIRHTDHYGFQIKDDSTRGPRNPAGTDAVLSWMKQRFPV